MFYSTWFACLPLLFWLFKFDMILIGLIFFSLLACFECRSYLAKYFPFFFLFLIFVCLYFIYLRFLVPCFWTCKAIPDYLGWMRLLLDCLFSYIISIKQMWCAQCCRTLYLLLTGVQPFVTCTMSEVHYPADIWYWRMDAPIVSQWKIFLNWLVPSPSFSTNHILFL